MQLLETINWALIAPVLIVQVILLIVAMVDLIKIEKTFGPKWLWGLVIVLFHIFGPILYFVVGRRNH